MKKEIPARLGNNLDKKQTADTNKLEYAIARARDLRPRTKQLYLQHVRAFVAFTGKTKAWSAGNVDAWRGDMLARAISPQSINVALGALRTAAKKATYKFADHITALEVGTVDDPDSGRALTWNEGKRLLAACTIATRARDLRDHAIVVLGLRTGMLRFSMCQLQFEHLNLSRTPKLTFIKKGGELHTVKLDPDTYSALQAWVDWLGMHDINSGFVFRSIGRERIQPDFGTGNASVTIGDKLTPDGLYRALKVRAVMAGLDDLSPHVFHCTFVAWAQRALGVEALEEAILRLEEQKDKAKLSAERDKLEQLIDDKKSVLKLAEAQIAVVTGAKKTAEGQPANFLIRSFEKD